MLFNNNIFIFNLNVNFIKQLKKIFLNLNIEKNAPSLMSRSSVTQSFLTGFLLLDLIAPLGMGQRQLIVGNLYSGKSKLLLNIMINKKRSNRFFSPEGFGSERVFCIYVAIGSKKQQIKEIFVNLKKSGALWYSILLNASASTSFANQFIAPFVGCAIGEVFRDNKNNALVMYDNLMSHANAYREMGLLTRKPPGREAYPGDTFYLHSRLLERSAQLSKKFGYGTLTALPVCGTFNNNISSYIVTNLISITDGQWFLRSDLALSGKFPSLDVEKSVSRIGAKAQPVAYSIKTNDFKHKLLKFNQYTQLLSTGMTLKNNEKKDFNHAKLINALVLQKKPINYETNLLNLYYSLNKSYCYKNIALDQKIKINKINKKNFWIMQLILMTKNSSKNIIKLIFKLLYYNIKNNK